MKNIINKLRAVENFDQKVFKSRVIFKQND